MNRVILSGNLATEPEVRYVGGGQTAMCSFRLAVQRRFSNAQGVREADFLNIVCWKSTAENVARYLHKGSKALVSGSVQERSYEKDGQKRYVIEVVADEVEFLSGGAEKKEAPFVQVDDEEMPWG